jgi:hypothetical protein
MDTPGPQDEATIKALKERQEADAAKSKWTSKLAKQRGLRWKRKTAKTSKAGGKKLKGRRSGGPTPPARRRFGEWCRAYRARHGSCQRGPAGIRVGRTAGAGGENGLAQR